MSEYKGHGFFDTYPDQGWADFDAQITNSEGDVLFEQKEVAAPETWDSLSVNIVASKYFYGEGDERESSVNVLIERVVGAIYDEGVRLGYFEGPEEANDFRNDLRYILVNQYAAFNSPVWFNVGLYDAYGITDKKGDSFVYAVEDPKENETNIIRTDPYVRPQASACFIISVKDSIEDIWRVISESARLFKYGSGVGADWSKLRSTKDTITGGGKPSGPVSFMRVQDATGGAIKSGGKTRRAAIMQTLRADHDDALAFVLAKAQEERKAHALIEAGYDGSFNGPAYATVGFQNANQSLRVTDTFMQTALDDVESKEAKLLTDVAGGTHICGDPGLQFEDEIQKWHTCKNTGPINSSNPCCFIGETFVDTSEGRLRIDSLVNKNGLYVFGYDGDNPVMSRMVRAWKAGQTKNLIEVRTDKGIVVRCTPEHRFLTYEGEYVEASKLTPGIRLRKLSRGENTNRSNRSIIYKKIGSGEYQSRFLWEEINGKIPNGYHVHHKNEDPTDDRLSNLELIESKEHWSLHSKGDNNPTFINIDEVLLLDIYDYVLNGEKKTHKNGKKFTVGRWNQAVRDLELLGQVPLAQSSGRIQGMSWSDFETRLQSLASSVNDTVSSIEFIELDDAVPVYDIEVEGTHNFAVSQGETSHSLFVSNSEYMFLDDSACNLSSINLLKFYQEDGSYDFDALRRTVDVLITAMDILVDLAGYPSEEIAKNSHEFRPLGLGFANLGALLMSMGLPYDSDEGRQIAACLMGIIHGQAYNQSAMLADRLGAFKGWIDNASSMDDVLEAHWQAAKDLIGDDDVIPDDRFTRELFYTTIDQPIEGPVRNSQVTVLAPTGTIAFMMGCDTTGIEPDLALVKYKLLAGEGDGLVKIVNRSVERALRKLGYHDGQIEYILSYIAENDTIEGCPELLPEHLPVFDCAFTPAKGERSISWKGHIDMMAALQPFVSGAISKTVNMPEDSTVHDIREAYVYAWRVGLKAVAIYRENSKRSQPLSTSRKKEQEPVETVVEKIVVKPERNKLPDERPSMTHKFSIGGHEGYLHIGMYPGTHQPGEIFITMSKQGSTIAGLMDSFATMVSLALQYGVPLKDLVEKFRHSRFEPSGFTNNQSVPTARSVVDYIFRYLETKFLSDTEVGGIELLRRRMMEENVPYEEVSSSIMSEEDVDFDVRTIQHLGDMCPECGSIMIQTGACSTCPNCGTTGGCG